MAATGFYSDNGGAPALLCSTIGHEGLIRRGGSVWEEECIGCLETRMPPDKIRGLQ